MSSLGGQYGVMVERASAGPVGADNASLLEDLVAAHYQRLLRVAVLICREPADAQDAVQVALERAWRSHGAVRNTDRLAAWLHRIVVRESVRAEHRRRGLLGRWLRPLQEIDVVTTDRADKHDLDLRKALDDLTVEHRAVLILHYYAGYSVAETAAACEIPFETARSRLRLARARLRLELGELT
jgi:RNA polymerase sigma factor (sigma-70 family)